MSETDDVKRPWDYRADYYSTSADDERLTHETLDECIAADLDDRTGPIEEVLSQDATIYAWRRDEIDIEDEAKSAIENMLESLSLHLLEEYGDPDGDSEDIFGAEAEATFKAAMVPAVRASLETVTVWKCSVIGERTFTPEELMEWVRQRNPKWLEGKS